MDYAEASKKVKDEKSKDNFLLVTFSYGDKLLLPYKDGIVFMSVFANAEQLDEDYRRRPNIKEFDRENIKTQILSRGEYERFKIAALLDITVDEVKAMQYPPQKVNPS